VISGDTVCVSQNFTLQTGQVGDMTQLMEVALRGWKSAVIWRGIPGLDQKGLPKTPTHGCVGARTLLCT
jgi:hypothetical protein